jgi:hypothetical protein
MLSLHASAEFPGRRSQEKLTESASVARIMSILLFQEMEKLLSRDQHWFLISRHADEQVETAICAASFAAVLSAVCNPQL